MLRKLVSRYFGKQKVKVAAIAVVRAALKYDGPSTDRQLAVHTGLRLTTVRSARQRLVKSGDVLDTTGRVGREKVWGL
jgi:transcription initiation factor TFIIIB Brf1 subunit/transcription initiation factor TFIIB